MKPPALLLLIVAAFVSCKKNCTDLILTKQSYTGSELKMNGYYYRVANDKNKYTKLFALYSNGVLLDMKNYENDNIAGMDAYINKEFLLSKNSLNDKAVWAFLI